MAENAITVFEHHEEKSLLSRLALLEPHSTLRVYIKDRLVSKGSN